MSTETSAADLGIVQAALENAHAQGWSDGLPVVPATRSRTDEFLATTCRPPDEVIGRLDHLRREVTVEVAAVNALMAGCLPEYFPVVLATWDALMLERATAGGGWQSTSGAAPLIVVNGPVRHRLGFNGADGVLGPGSRAGATVARAMGLIVRNGLGVRSPATQGIPGRWSMCIGENEEESPWPPLSVDGGVTAGTDAVSATLLRNSEFVDNRHTDDPEKLLNDFADTLSRTGALVERYAGAGVVFCPDHAQLLARAGMSKDEVRAWLVERCGRPRSDLRRVGKNGITDNGVRFDLADGDRTGFDPTFASDSPQNLVIAVAGARGVASSTVVRLFANWSQVAARVEAPPESPDRSRRPQRLGTVGGKDV